MYKLSNAKKRKVLPSDFFFLLFLRSTEGGEITVYGLTDIARQVSIVGLHVKKQT